jgi:hypothetical protein
VVWLHDEGAFVYKLEIVEDSSLEQLILSHQTKNLKFPPDTTITINYDEMKIEVQNLLRNEEGKPIPFSKAAITLEAADLDNGKTVEQNIALAISYQKTLVNKYKESGN